MSQPVDFYFDFSSPYGYFAAAKVDALAARHGCSTTWRPILLGAVFKVTGQRPLPAVPMKGSYVIHDLLRSARWFGLPFRMPGKFPVPTIAPCRAYYWLHDRDPAAAKTLAFALLRAYFVEDRDISSPEVTANVAAKLGHDKDTVLQALNDPAVKERLKAEVDAAIERGVFGSPYIIVDREPFWGSDRLDQVEQWLARGKW
ncbi:MAG: 2-hydroxychromene-2-carboxylate isomerase [Burkholderiales bacterium]|nr:2-hydroxychromene-2-carboxylate isomerase [Burkholderiales bacterium]MDP2399806.1 2-hydroxychromene-2-carboxylate isomerase [Burkholderiales bacterium]MDP3714886.1 2-hydroxychromene-2-carboxylate isomerase [Burkholderiales bacterium]